MEFNPKMENWFTLLVTVTAGTATCVGLSLFAGESGLVDQTDVWILWFILTTHYSYILLSKISLQSLQHQTDWITTLCLELHVKDISNLPYCFTYKKLYIDIKSRNSSPVTSNKWFSKPVICIFSNLQRISLRVKVHPSIIVIYSSQPTTLTPYIL